MPVIKTYLAEPQTLAGTAIVTALYEGEKPGQKPIVRLSRTWFHPQGGGQKGDRGSIGPAAVIDTKHAEEGEVDHFVASLDGLAVGETYPVAVDAAWRRDNAASHSAGHLIAALVDPAFSQIKAVQGHHWPGESRVEFASAMGGAVEEGLAAKVAAFLQPALDDALAARWPVALMGDPFANRSIKIGASEQVPCGGTHVAHLGQIKKVTVKSVKQKGDRIRVSYEAEADGSAFA